jgi:hypothetical protein
MDRLERAHATAPARLDTDRRALLLAIAPGHPGTAQADRLPATARAGLDRVSVALADRVSAAPAARVPAADIATRAPASVAAGVPARPIRAEAHPVRGEADPLTGAGTNRFGSFSLGRPGICLGVLFCTKLKKDGRKCGESYVERDTTTKERHSIK